MFKEIMEAVKQKKNSIQNSFAQGAQAMGNFANQNTGFNPYNQQLPQLQTNNGGILGMVNNWRNNQTQQPSLSAIGQEIQNQTEDKDLYNYLRI